MIEYISVDLFEDYAIKKFIYENGHIDFCDWTEKESTCIEIGVLAEFIEQSILHEYGDPYDLGAGYDKEEVYYEDRFPGLYVQTSLELLTGLLIELPFEILDILSEMMENEYWTENSLYVPTEGQILYESWEQFCYLIKHKVRFMFFSPILERTKPSYEDYNDPYSILHVIGKSIKKHKLVTTYPPNELRVFRARQHHEDIEVRSIDEIGPPPENKAKANRLSPAGITMFYAAFDKNTAVLEVIDFGKTDETISIALFKNVKTLNLIDLSKLEWISIFDQERRHLRNSYVLLNKLTTDIRKPVSNDDRQHIDYIPTQVVTEYLKNSFRLSSKKDIHGIVYPSAKHEEKNCVVLFFTREQLTENGKKKSKFLKMKPEIEEFGVQDISVTIKLDGKTHY